MTNTYTQDEAVRDILRITLDSSIRPLSQTYGDQVREILDQLIATTRRETVEKCRRWINYAMLPYPNKYGDTISVSRHNRMIEELEELLDQLDQLPDKQEV